MNKTLIQELINRYITLTNDVWKRGEVLVREEIGSDLTNDQLYLLRYVNQHKQCTTTELAEVFFVQKSAISAIVNRLVEKNLMERSQDKEDRRIVVLSLTDEGKELYLKMESKIFKLVESFITQFNEKEITQFMQSYEKLAKILKDKMEEK
ncbi:MarR family transcriptional regulator [Caldibacillus lycopersici]|uniref:MarR family transcriptional regulator n=1 Tax=Perspicuibacillus lycopersici TaxID=1325689 RepID=A0AAE3LMN4_9BACI|nr:MarR family transcriptional regulator [Perspicuibacillus lycopersici]MCU9612942.1 MarR family transcriptional regulator [Perspicuibacillus lycopersici]